MAPPGKRRLERTQDPGHRTYKAGVPATALTTFSIQVCEAANNTFRKHVHSNVVHNSAVIIYVLTLEETSGTRTQCSMNPFPIQPSN